MGNLARDVLFRMPALTFAAQEVIRFRVKCRENRASRMFKVDEDSSQIKILDIYVR